MQQPSALTDRRALGARRRRARPEALFLHDEAWREIEQRLEDVNRTFTAPAVVTGHPAAWQGRLPGATTVADDEVLHLEPGAHDLIVHAMALHWANDPVGQLIQCRRALRPDGLFLAVLFGGRTLSELRAALAEAEVALKGGLSPRVAPMGEIRDLGGLLQRAGFALPVADSVVLPVRYRDTLSLMRDLRLMGEGNALAQRDRRPPGRALFAETGRIHARSFPRDGGVAATFELVFLTGWAPADSQPRPLRPGSAQARLADALGVAEHQAGEIATPRHD
ncbi:MAG: methyltransferase domain-containing protein [Tranquillimonas sp.]